MFYGCFLINYYLGKDINALNSSCSLMDLLLKYHEPEIYNKFNIAFITPQIYATNWLLTCLSNKNLDIININIIDKDSSEHEP